jgi:hypothetical protein
MFNSLSELQIMKKTKRLLLAAGLMVVGSTAFASNITVHDFASIADGGTLPGSAYGWNGGPLGVGLEDNETEQVSTPSTATIRNQSWDMEGFSVSGKNLYMVGGYDQVAGNEGFSRGTIFIKVGGALPGDAPLTPGSGNVLNSIYGYDYAVDPITGLVTKLKGTTVLNTTVYDQLGSNPWKVDTTVGNPNNGTLTTGHSYVAGLNATGVGSLTGESTFNALRGDNGGNGGVGGTAAVNKHNVATIDLTFLGNIAANTPVYFSYTMECGNDSLKGLTVDGFKLVPDGGTSLMLLGMGLSSLVVAGRRFRVC